MTFIKFKYFANYGNKIAVEHKAIALISNVILISQVTTAVIVNILHSNFSDTPGSKKVK